MNEDRSTPDDAQRPEGEPRFSFTDKRKVDPTDGSVRPSGPAPAKDGSAEQAPKGESPADASAAPVDPIDAEAAKLYEQAGQGEQEQGEQPAGASPEQARISELEQEVNRLGEQLKRDQAEYVNSRRRIEAAAETGKEAAVGRVLASLIGVLDDVELGRQHGDIAEGTPFHSITQKLEEVLAGHGLHRFGAVGETFDPTLHEALMHEQDDEADEATISLVVQPGYRMHERVLRPARVGTRGPA
ncbi:nucleotide exchange factor GrpE [Brachybacterium sp. Marseille-Q2903]|uniref:Protein GrpE n=1 Tax=Brachybacterium epidermidis TaxID=2781983 RepID=A0ABR9W0S9_9MICO|nr:nucleotide exchange factor GrpE [Brachybacterium epidermidis]MBE9404057.1 nucleotide exchange factor GrpE [Brachybacterium epidermidis]